MTYAQARLVIVVSAFLHAAWNAGLRRLQLRGAQAAGPLVLLASLLLGGAALLASGHAVRLTPYQAACAAAAGLGEAGYFWTLGPALAAMPLGQAYAWIRGGGMLVVGVLSMGLLGETWTATGFAGAAVLLAGLFLPTTRGQRVWARPPAAVVGCCLATAGYHLAYGEGLRAGAPALALFCASMGIAAPLVAVGMGRRGAVQAASAFKGAPFAVIWTAGLSTAAFTLFLLSLRHMGAGMGFALRNTSIVFAQLFGFWGGEPMRARTLVRTALVFVGACLVAAG